MYVHTYSTSLTPLPFSPRSRLERIGEEGAFPHGPLQTFVADHPTRPLKTTRGLANDVESLFLSTAIDVERAYGGRTTDYVLQVTSLTLQSPQRRDPRQMMSRPTRCH